MQFKDLKDGYLIYLFDKDNYTVKTGKVSNVTPPHASAKPGATLASLGLVVDVIANVDGKNFSYEVKDNSESAYIDNILLSSNIDVIVAEIKALKSQNEEVLRSRERSEKNVKRCDELLAEFDPIFREKKETDDKIATLTQTVASLAQVVERLNKKIQ